MQRVAIVEAKHSHEEVILPQVELLRNDFEVHVVAPESLLAVDLLADTSHLFQAHPYGSAPHGSRSRRLLGVPSAYLAIGRILSDIKPDVVVFNSTYSLPEVALIHSLFPRTKKIQIIHNFQQYLPRSAHWLYRSFDANLVISEQVHRYVLDNHREFSDLDYFLPIFFDSDPHRDAGQLQLPGSDQPQLVLGVFGSIDKNRRNYAGLLEALREWRRPHDGPGLQLYLVGRAPAWVKEYIHAHELEGTVKYYDRFVSFAEMFSLLERVDLVMFLIDGSVKNAQHYNKYKITGTSTLMKAFKKAGVSSSDFLVDASLADKCFYYPGADVGAFLKEAGDGTITREQVQAKIGRYQKESAFSFEEQRERLLSTVKRAVVS